MSKPEKDFTPHEIYEIAAWWVPGNARTIILKYTYGKGYNTGNGVRQPSPETVTAWSNQNLRFNAERGDFWITQIVHPFIWTAVQGEWVRPWSEEKNTNVSFDEDEEESLFSPLV